jgi:hypothetical protein
LNDKIEVLSDLTAHPLHQTVKGMYVINHETREIMRNGHCKGKWHPLIFLQKVNPNRANKLEVILWDSVTNA